MNKVVIPVADFDNHDCKAGPESGCRVCVARAEFYAVSRRKWEALQEKWRQVRERASNPSPDAMVVAAILTTNEEDN